MIFRVILSIALSACAYDAHFEDCVVHCSSDTGCPDGLTCGAEGLCRTSEAQSCAPVVGASPSCAGLATSCGPTGTDDCCSTAMPIPGGTYYRSYDVAADGMYADASYPATVSAFTLDKYEVTVGRFRTFVEAGQGTAAKPPPRGAGARELNGISQQGGWDPAWDVNLATDTTALGAAVKCDGTFQTWTDAPDANEDLPINCVTWHEAFAFCAWDGGFLPTEAEWNYAAAGGDEQRAYPWSSPAGSTTIDCSYANYKIDVPSGTYCVNGALGGVNRVGSESPKGDGRWGQSDLGGNVYEWAIDWYQSPYAKPCDDCADLTAASVRVFRGGIFFSDRTLLRGAFRFYNTTARSGGVGVRCARAP